MRNISSCVRKKIQMYVLSFSNIVNFVHNGFLNFLIINFFTKVHPMNVLAFKIQLVI